MMKSREKLIAVISGCVGGLLIVLLIVNTFVLAPLSDMAERREKKLKEISALEIEKRAIDAARARLRKVAERRVGNDELRVSETVRVRLDQLLQQSGLGNERLSIKPMVGQTVSGAFREVGSTVRARGSLDAITDFLYLLDHQPYLLRVDDLSLTPVSRSTDLDLEVKCSTLVFDLGKQKPGEVDLGDAGLDVALDTSERERYAAITRRDLFRPFIAYVEPPARPVARATPEAPPAEAPPAAPTPSMSRFKVVSLSQWNGESEVLVRDVESGGTTAYKAGESLAGGTIERIDYRALPHPDNAALLCQSRVIVKIGPEYWAIELGRTLAQRRRMSNEELPDDLKVTQTSHPLETADATAPPR